MNIAYIALGSNIEPRGKYLEEAIALLSEHEKISVEKESSIYETVPVGYTDQDLFLNMVVEIHTELSPYDLLYYCQHIENHLGRKRTIRYGPRTVDLDILLYNQESVDDEALTIPHPRMYNRAFVLIPLAEINPNLSINGTSVEEYIHKLDEQDCRGVMKWHQINGE